MIIVDTEIAKRIAEDRPIRVGMIGAGYSAKHIASQIISSFPGMHLVAIANRTVSNAVGVFNMAGVEDVKEVKSSNALEDVIKKRGYAVTDNAEVLFQTESIDAIIETTGEVEYGAWAALNSIKAGKHTVVLNCEMDATVGPILKTYADKQGVIYTNTDGDV